MSSSGTGAGATAGTGGTGGIVLTGGGAGLGTSGSGTSGSSTGGTCAGDVTMAKVIPLDMFVMLDISGSMLANTSAGTSKWNAVKSAFGSFFADAGSQGLGVGLQYFPLPKSGVPAACTAAGAECDASGAGPCFIKRCTSAPNLIPCSSNADCTAAGANGNCVAFGTCANDSAYLCTPSPTGGTVVCPTVGGVALGNCQAIPAGSNKCFSPSVCDFNTYAVYAAPAVPLTVLSASTAATFTSSLNAQTPAGDTPTLPALMGAIKAAADWKNAHADHTVVAVLATDGLPTTECHSPPLAQTTAQAVSDVSAVATTGVGYGIDTFVIGVFGADDIAAGAPANLNDIAQKGGTTSAFVVDTTQDVSAQFVAALNAIRSKGIACEFQIPPPTGTDTLDFGKVNVNFTDQGTTSVLDRRGSSVATGSPGTACDASGGWYYDVNPSAGVSPSKIIACPSTCTTLQATVGGSVSIQVGCEQHIR